MSTNGTKSTYPCAGAKDQEALIDAGKVVEANADPEGTEASVTIAEDAEDTGPGATVGEMTKKAV